MGGAYTEISATTTDVLVEAGDLGPDHDRPHRPPPQAAERGGEALRARRRPADVADRGRARRRSCSSSSPAGPRMPPARSTTTRCRPPPIELPLAFPAAIVGVEYTPEQVVSTLELIGATVSVAGDVATVTPPTWRPDLTDKVTLVEEVARIVGYDRIPSVLPIAPAGRGLTRAQRARRRVGQTLAAAGATEVLTLSVPLRGDRRAVRAGSRRRAPRERARPARVAAAPHPAARPARDRPPQPVARPHRPRAVRGRHRVPPGARRRLRHRLHPGRRRTTG